MKLVAAILDPVQIARLCQNLGEPAQPPPVQPPHALRACGPTRFQVQTGWDLAAPPAQWDEPPVEVAEKAGQWADPPADFAADLADLACDFADPP